jgi:LDH2 family malate/lactate/ureidoglycolate dehydrogenase
MPKKPKPPKKPKKKLTPEQKAEKRRRKAEFETIFVGGKQKRVKRREPLVEGIPVDEFIRRNADPIWLHQNELWEYMEPSRLP